jgi:co-chaperonin GroES (HSP10)
MELKITPKNQMLYLEELKAPTTTESGIDLSAAEGEIQRIKNNFPFKVLIVEEQNPVGVSAGDYVYLRPGATIYKMRLEGNEVLLCSQFDVVGITTSFDYERHSATLTTIKNPIIS